MFGVRLQDVQKTYGKLVVIDNLNLDIKTGELCVIVGPSGCGKSTVLRIIAGLEDTSKGHIFIGDRDVTKVDPSNRKIAMVFQTYALYPHMSVRENIGFGLKMNGVAKAKIEQQVQSAAQTLRLSDYLDRKPSALSGGQRQRVAIGRALVRHPEVFLFDEPLSNLDAELRLEMRVEIARLHRNMQATMIYVTHDQVEAMTLADKIVVLRKGRIEQVGTPQALYNTPQNRFVAEFIGAPSMNFLNATVQNKQIHITEIDQIVDNTPNRLPTTRDILLGIRPQHIRLNHNKTTHRVEMTESLGAVNYVHVQKDNKTTIVEISEATNQNTVLPRIGDKVGLQVLEHKIHTFDPQTEQRIS